MGEQAANGKTAIISAAITGIVSIMVTLISTKQVNVTSLFAGASASESIVDTTRKESASDPTNETTLDLQVSGICSDVVDVFNEMENNFAKYKATKDVANSTTDTNHYLTNVKFENYDSHIEETTNTSKFVVSLYEGKDYEQSSTDLSYFNGKFDECLNQFKKTAKEADGITESIYTYGNKHVVLQWYQNEKDNETTYFIALVFLVNR
ncbi:hypothetical protein HRH25_12420 [Flavisolibacter sp. BT320]|nr:hypothetical protein [Flavisolibacter longurius]